MSIVPFRVGAVQKRVSMTRTLYIITGAPGAGKSTALSTLLGRPTPYLAFDMDWLLPAASQLARCDVRTDQASWPAYNRLWLDILQAVYRNGKLALLFAPLDRDDTARVGSLTWVEQIAWLLLDCDAQIRRSRLRARPGWSEDQIVEATHERSTSVSRSPAGLTPGLAARLKLSKRYYPGSSARKAAAIDDSSPRGVLSAVRHWRGVRASP